jgi:valyl-tRNA synthetase
VYCFDVALRLLHPVVPFITEELWQKLPGRQPGELLAVAPWPAPEAGLADRAAEAQFERVKTAIEHIRSIRAEYRISPKSRLKAAIVPRGRDVHAAFEGERDTILRLAQLESLTIDGSPGGVGASAVFGDGSEVFVALGGEIDVQQECRRLRTEQERLDKQLEALAQRLANEAFVSKAPPDVVAAERAKEQTWREQRTTLAAKLKALGC